MPKAHLFFGFATLALISACGSPTPEKLDLKLVDRNQQSLTGENSASALALEFATGAVAATERQTAANPLNDPVAAPCIYPTLGASFPANAVAGPTVNLNFGGCRDRVRIDGTWRGTENWTFDSEATEASFEKWTASSLIANGTLLRTLAGSVGSTIGTLAASDAFQLTGTTGVVDSFSTSRASLVCYNGAAGCPSDQGLKTIFSTTTSASGAAEQLRFASIEGVRWVETSAGSTKATLDETITSGPIIVQGVGRSKTVVGGEVRIFHNLSALASVTKITQAHVWSTDTCFPTSGELTTTYSNGKTETLTLTGGKSGTLTGSALEPAGTTSHVMFSRCF